MDAIKQMAIQAALKKMEDSGYFDICTIDKIIRLTGAIPNGENYKVLSLLHCVNFRDMRPELLRGLPVLIQSCICTEPLNLSATLMPAEVDRTLRIA